MRPSSSEERYQELASKWLSNTISPEEEKEFALWYNKRQDNEVDLPEGFVRNEEELRSRIYSVIEKRGMGNKPSWLRLSQRWFAAAALIILILSTGLFFYSQRAAHEQLVLKDPASGQLLSGTRTETPASSKSKAIPLVQGDIPAGRDEAILTLADGTKIILDDVRNGIVAHQDGNSILKTADGELIYSFSEANAIPSDKNTESTSFNTIETPKGGKFQIKLPDGSKVWLNAASSLRFPASFNGLKRQVELTGEAYFEVAPDPSRIFEVLTRDQAVQVLGTHFNINAYTDEPSVNTTLLEGSVRINDLRTNNSQLLKPGEQAKLTEKIEVVNVSNVAEAVAWKDGYFQFNDADIQVIMRQIERWYDVRVSYEEGHIPSKRFGGEIERSLSLLQVLKILEKANIRFHLEGRELLVMK